MIRLLGIALLISLTWVAYVLYQASVNPVYPIVTTTNSGKIVSKTTTIVPVAPIVEAQATVSAPEVTVPSIPVVDPSAPCPEKIDACFGALANNILDVACPEYKPVWAYYSKDDGLTWGRVGCYATEIDAEKAIEKARKTGELQLAKQRQNEINHSAPETTRNSAQLVPPERKAKIAEIQAEEKIEQQVIPVSEPTAELPPTEADNTANANAAIPTPSKKGYEAEFKAGIGIFTMATRTYPTEGMRKKALEMWEKDQRLLEPNGTINEKYVLKKPATTPLPGHY